MKQNKHLVNARKRTSGTPLCEKQNEKESAKQCEPFDVFCDLLEKNDVPNDDTHQGEDS